LHTACGIDPVKSLSSKAPRIKPVAPPNELGMVPVNLFDDKSAYLKLGLAQLVLSTFPLNVLPDTSRNSSAPSLVKEGSEPSNSTLSSATTPENVNVKNWVSKKYIYVFFS
jgi:hypothetical protein